jgi:phosphoribosylcarboxyaminoimidazole (NCAIR) mutase
MRKKVYLAGPGLRVGLLPLIRYRLDYGARLRSLGYFTIDPYEAFLVHLREVSYFELERMASENRDKLLLGAIDAAAKVDPYFELVRRRAVDGGLSSVDGVSLPGLATTAQVDEIERADAGRISECDILVAYLPQPSPGTLREATIARSMGILRFAFGMEKNALENDADLFSAVYPTFDELASVLEVYISGVGSYLTTAPVAGVRGHLLLYAVEVATLFPHLLIQVASTLSSPRRLHSFCCESSHVHELAQKLPVMLRLGGVADVTVLTKDGSPHDVQMHTIVQEVIDNVEYRGNVRHIVIEKGRLKRISQEAVKASRHLHTIEELISQCELHDAEGTQPPTLPPHPPHVAVIAGGECDLQIVHAAGLAAVFEHEGISYSIDVISSDREPERLRKHCIAKGATWDAVVAIAGGVPNLPIVVKSWLPDVPVVSVPVDERLDVAAAALTTPSDAPVILAGYGERGIRKAGKLVVQLIKWRSRKPSAGLSFA